MAGINGQASPIAACMARVYIHPMDIVKNI